MRKRIELQNQERRCMNRTQGIPPRFAACCVLFALFLLAGCAQHTAVPTAPVWDADQLAAGLRAAGAIVEDGEATREPFFSAPGRRMVVNGQKIIVFQYSSASAREQESSTISPDGFGVGNSLVDWVDVPHFWASGRLIVLYLGTDQPTIDLLNKLLGSQLNQPPA